MNASGIGPVLRLSAILVTTVEPQRDETSWYDGRVKLLIFPEARRQQVEAVVREALGHSGGTENLTLTITRLYATGWTVHATGLSDEVLVASYCDGIRDALRRSGRLSEPAPPTELQRSRGKASHDRRTQGDAGPANEAGQGLEAGADEGKDRTVFFGRLLVTYSVGGERIAIFSVPK